MLKDHFLADFNSLPENIREQVKILVETMSKSIRKEKPGKKRKAGLLKGKIRLDKSFDAPLKDFADYQ